MADAVDFLNSAQAAAYLQIDIRTLGAWRSQGSGPCFYRVALNTAAPISISVCNSTVSRLPATASGESERSRLGRRAWRALGGCGSFGALAAA